MPLALFEMLPKKKQGQGRLQCMHGMGCMYQQGWQVQHGYFLDDGRTAHKAMPQQVRWPCPPSMFLPTDAHPPLPITRAVGQDGSLITTSHGRGLRTLSSPSPPTTTPRPISKHAFLQNESHLLSQYDHRASSCQPASQAIPPVASLLCSIRSKDRITCSLAPKRYDDSTSPRPTCVIQAAHH